jgi:hypothetical protein
VDSAQASLFQTARGRRLLLRTWRTWKGKRMRKPGRYPVWGIVEEFHAANKIMCDFDTAEIPSPAVNSLIHTLGLTICWQRWDRTRRGWHLVLKVRERLSDGEIIAAQAILGSDRNRERLNLARAISIRLHPSAFWRPRINVLFSSKIKTRKAK